jgi:hypothetical protein
MKMAKRSPKRVEAELNAAAKPGRALAVACPECGEWPGDPCTTMEGRPMSVPHWQRLKRWRVASSDA